MSRKFLIIGGDLASQGGLYGIFSQQKKANAQKNAARRF